MSVYLQSVYNRDYIYYLQFLYRLLSQRTPEQSISHKEMPNFEQHKKFVDSRPYKDWYIIEDEECFARGSVYITHKNEIGIFIEKYNRGIGYGKETLKEIFRKYPNVEFYANINPKNEKSIKFFEKFGFILDRKEEKQLVYKRGLNEVPF